MKKVTVIGGLPEPIGGVTNFIKRLASDNMVSEIIDLYPSGNKLLPPSFIGNVVYLNSIFNFICYYFLKFSSWKGRILHFNFSRTRSLFLFLLLPKFGSEFHLMLHHGVLSKSTLPFFDYLVLRKMDVIYSLNSNQKKFYLDSGVSLSNIYECASYIRPIISEIACDVKDAIDSFFYMSDVIVASGRPDSIYNHLWNIEFIIKNTDYKLALFIYDKGDCHEEITSMASKTPNVKIFYGCNEDEFLYALTKAKLYSRPTKVDSFGIAVADAIELDCLVVASDVCERYRGAYLFTPTTYEFFSSAMIQLLNGNMCFSKVSQKNIVPFKYQ